MQVKVLIPAAAPVLTLEEVKAFLKVEDTLEHNLLEGVTAAIISLSEKYTSLCFAEKTLLCYIDKSDLEYGSFELPLGPHIEINAITRIDDDGTETVLEQSEYKIRGLDYLEFFPPQRWTTKGDLYSAYKIEYKAGFAQGELDPLIKQAMLRGIAELYENRGNTIIGTIVADLPYNTKFLLSPFKRNPLL